MTTSIDERFQPIRSGLLECAVLSVISRGDVYAADILAKLAGTEFATLEGTLYPLLSKLRREEFVDYEWRESDAGPPRKYYSLTKKGTEHLEDIKDYLNRIETTLSKLAQKIK
ncbi:MAG: transcriptional regulator, PadR-like family [Candidatus Kaiserbacteria bacterium]|nr:transcriptional regulator, PadR-like family [Candidatus Kaiserbacteria bacterium]